jgi:hypothetical protein
VITRPEAAIGRLRQRDLFALANGGKLRTTDARSQIRIAAHRQRISALHQRKPAGVESVGDHELIARNVMPV